MREYKDGSVVNRVVTPPALPTIVEPRAADRAEHVAAKYPRADILEALADHVVIQARRSAFATMHLLVGARREHPSEDRQPSDAKRIGKILVGTGAIAIERYRKTVNAKLGHEKTSRFKSAR